MATKQLRLINLNQKFSPLSKKKIRDYIGVKTTKQLIGLDEIELTGNKVQDEKRLFKYFGEQYNDAIREERSRIADIRKKDQYLYSGILIIKKYVRDKDGTLRLVKTENRQVALMKKSEVDAMKKQAEEEDGYVEEVEEQLNKVKNPALVARTNIMRSPIREAGSMNIDGFIKNEVWDKGNDTCVPDWLTYYYSDVKKRCTKSVKDYETIERLSTTTCGQVVLNNEPNKNGYTIDNVRLFARNVGIGLYVLHNDKIIVEERSSGKKYPLVIEIKNNHLYPIINRDKINSISKRSVESNIVTKGKSESVSIPKNIVFITETIDNPIQYALKVMKQNNLQVYKGFSIANNNLMNFTIEDTLYVTSHFSQDVKDFVEEQGEEYIGQNPLQFVSRLMTDIPSSFMNNEIRDALLTEGVKNRTHIGLFNEEERPTLKPVDFNKFYRSIMEKPFDNFMTIDFNTTPQPYDGKAIKFGLYYVKTEDLTLLHQSNWYSNTMVQNAIDKGIDMEIQYFIKGKREDKSILKNIIDKILDMGDYKQFSNIFKLMINSICGFLGKHKTSRTSLYVDTDVNNVWNKYFSLVGDDKLIYENEKGLYAYGVQKSTIKLNNNIAMYIQILDWSNIMLDNLIRSLGGYENLYYRKTDCVVMYDVGQELKPSKKVGGYDIVEEEINSYKIMDRERAVGFTKNENTIKHIDTIQNSDDTDKVIAMLEKGKSILLNARAGTGKSYTIEKVSDYFTAKGLVVHRIAFTNKASNNINGCTIHKLLGIDENGMSNQKQITKRMANTAVVCIDEISMINKDLWKQIYQLKIRYPKIAFMLSGDPRQLPPVEDEPVDYFNHPTIQFIADYNNIEYSFFEKCRYDKELYDYLEDISLENSLKVKLPVGKSFGVSNEGHNLCYSNKKRKEINAMFNDHYRKSRISMYVEYVNKIDKEGNEIDSKYNQSFYVYDGLPIIANVTIGSSIMKNETFVIDKIDYDKNMFHITISDDEDAWYPVMDIHKFFTICYAMTIHKSQGDTIRSVVNIHEFNKIRTDKKLFYTAVSRATSISNIRYF